VPQPHSHGSSLSASEEDASGSASRRKPSTVGLPWAPAPPLAPRPPRRREDARDEELADDADDDDEEDEDATEEVKEASRASLRLPRPFGRSKGSFGSNPLAVPSARTFGKVTRKGRQKGTVKG